MKTVFNGELDFEEVVSTMNEKNVSYIEAEMLVDIVTTSIPFAGFYNSIHSDSIDSQMEDDLEYSESEFDSSAYFDALKNEKYDYDEICRVYAKEYAEEFITALNHEFELSVDLKSTEIESPRFYNFTTDRIFIDITYFDMLKVYNYVITHFNDDFIKSIADRFTSCSGFISSYPNRLSEWGNLDTWDHNQYGTLFEVLMNNTDIGEWEIMADSYGNGIVNEAIDAGIESYRKRGEDNA